MKFNRTYFILTIILFLVELYIGFFIKDRFIRPYFGDFLVVILIYCFVRSFWDVPVFKTAIGVLIFSFVVEFLQYFDIVGRLGLADNQVASVLIGTSFAWEDLLAYALGIVAVLVVEFASKKNRLQAAQ